MSSSVRRGQFSVGLSMHEAKLVVQAVIETLRFVASISEHPILDDLLCDAKRIEEETWSTPVGVSPCPLCEEVECDGDCPLREVPRAWAS